MHNILEKDENNKALQTTLLEEEGQSALFVVDLNLKIVYVGKRVLELLNSPMERFLGKQFSDALPLFTADGIEVIDEMHPVEKIFKPPFRQMTPFFCILDSNLPNSADVYVIRATAVKKADAVIGAIVSIRKAQRNLNVADMKTLFVSFAAHQLKTPSSIVKGFLELLLREGRGAFKDEQWNNLASAYEANEQLIGVSKALLNLSKLEGGLIEPVMGEFNPTSVLNDKIRSYELQLKAKNVSISFVHPHTETFVVTDKSLFVEVFDVILNNAVKYSPVGGQIVITLENTKKELKVSIKDSGPGMSIHEQEELFTKNLSITDYHTGHGLGIMMAKRYLTLLKGVLYVNDNTPKGTVFSFSIPLY